MLGVSADVECCVREEEEEEGGRTKCYSHCRVKGCDVSARGGIRGNRFSVTLFLYHVKEQTQYATSR